jgi:hypothetical protein
MQTPSVLRFAGSELGIPRMIEVEEKFVFQMEL